MPAFVFARMTFRGRDLLFNFFTLGLLFPIAVAILPLYITLRQANLVDSLWGIILPQVAFGLPGSILILRGFFATVPRELDEAAAIDGCSPVGFFVRVLLPLMRPALAAVAVLTMVGSWNNFFLPLLVLNSEPLYTLPLGIMQFQGQFGTDWGERAGVRLARAGANDYLLPLRRAADRGWADRRGCEGLMIGIGDWEVALEAKYSHGVSVGDRRRRLCKPSSSSRRSARISAVDWPSPQSLEG